MSRTQRDIGKAAERELVRLVDGRYRHRESGIVEARTGRQHRGGPDSPDVITNLPGIHWEITRNHHVRPGKQGMRDKLMQAAEDAGREQVPYVLWRPRGDTRWRVTCMAQIQRSEFDGLDVILSPRNPLSHPGLARELHEITLWLETALLVMGCEPCVEPD